jgi:hypothetical protein
MERRRVDQAGVPFLSVNHHDGGLFRQPGLFRPVRRFGEERILHRSGVPRAGDLDAGGCGRRRRDRGAVCRHAVVLLGVVSAA